MARPANLDSPDAIPSRRFLSLNKPACARRRFSLAIPLSPNGWPGPRPTCDPASEVEADPDDRSLRRRAVLASGSVIRFAGRFRHRRLAPRPIALEADGMNLEIARRPCGESGCRTKKTAPLGGARRRPRNGPSTQLGKDGQPPQIIRPMATNRGADAKRQITETQAIVSARPEWEPDTTALSLCTVMSDIIYSPRPVDPATLTHCV